MSPRCRRGYTPGMHGGFRRRAAPCLLGVLVLSCATQSIHERNWLSLRTAHYEISSALSPKDTSALGRALEVFRAGAGHALGMQLPAEAIPTRVYAFDGRTIIRPFDLRGVSGYFLPGLGGDAIVLRTGDGWEDATPELKSRHVQQLLRAHDSRRRPLWYEEGMGAFASTIESRGWQARVGLPRGDYVTLLRDWHRSSFRGLLATRNFDDFSGRDRKEFHAQAWAVVHYAKLGHAIRSGPRQPLVHYRRLLDDDVAPLQAAETAFGADPAELASQVIEYVERDKMSWLSIQSSKPALPPKPDLRPLSKTQALLTLGWLAVELRRSDIARGYFEMARSSDPGNAEAEAGLGTADRLDARWEEAGEHFRRALATAPGNAQIQLEAGNYYQQRAAATSPTAERADLAGQARDHYRRSLGAEGAHPAAHAMLGASYLLPGEDPALGVAPLEAAAGLLPGSLEVEFLQARLQAALGHVALARIEASNALSRSGSLRIQEDARQFLDSLDVSRAASKR